MNPSYIFKVTGKIGTSYQAGIGQFMKINLKKLFIVTSILFSTLTLAAQYSYTDFSGTFDDGSGAAQYSNYFTGSYLIQPAGASTVTLSFTSFNTETNYDFVYVYDGADEYAPLIGQYHNGNPPPAVITSSGNSLFIRFTTDGSVTYDGWTVQYSGISGSVSYTYTDFSGTFDDGSGAAQYSNNFVGTYLIQPAGASTVTLSFTSFNIEGPNYDYVSVYDGADANAPLIGRYHNVTPPPATITSSGNSLFIRFTTDGSVTYDGWTVQYSGISGSVSYTYTDFSGTFDDGSGAAQYSNNFVGSYLIQPSGASIVTLSFTSFNTETNWDFVSVYDGANENAPLVGRYHNGNPPPATITSSANSLFIRFTTDETVTYDGWTVQYSGKAKGQKFANTEVWSSSPFLGYWIGGAYTMTRVADVDGDGKNDIIAIKQNGIFVRRSNGCTFTNDELWLSGSFGGANEYDEYSFADVNGDGAADLIKINYDNMSVKLSNGSTYESSPWTVWLSGNFKHASGYGYWFADVNGDGKKDFIRIINDLPFGTYVSLSTGSNFMPGTKWGSKAYMDSGLFADVDGDGMADLVDELIMNGVSQAYFDLSLGDKFSTSFGYMEPEDRINAYAFADFTGDGRVDIFFKTNNLMIKRSTGDSFSNYETWQYGNDLDNTYNLFADVTGDGRADIIMFSENDVRVKRTINDCYVTGPDLVCNSGYTFTVTNLPSGTVTWSQSSNLTYVSGQNTNSYVVGANGNGAGWIEATINSSCGSVTLPQYAVWVGTPILNYVTGPESGYTYNTYTFYADPRRDPHSQAEYTWILNPLNGNSVRPYYDYADIAFYTYGGYQVVARAENTCGMSDWAVTEISISDNYGYSLSPNPASDNVTITMNENPPLVATNDSDITNMDMTNTNSDEPTIYTIRVYNTQSTMLSSVTRTGKSFTIPLNNLRDGIYILEVRYAKNSYRKQLIVKHN